MNNVAVHRIAFWLARKCLPATIVLILTAAMPVPPLQADQSLYRALGGQDGLTRIVHRLLQISVADPRIKHTFADLNIPRIETRIVDQFCELSGGPCKYKGKAMHKSHKGYKITVMEFNALVENLQDAMDAENVSNRAQNRLLALLAPMQRDIVTR